MIAGSVLFIAAVPSRPAVPPPPEPAPIEEAPWLSREGAATIIAPGGGLGPLFDGVVLGGSAPDEATRARIAKFARDNHVTIDLEIANDELAAIRFEVVYPGCCGFEGAGVLGLRLQRPKTGGGCMGAEPDFLDDWVHLVGDDDVYMRARLRGNRVEVRWEPAAKLDAVLARADQLVGKSVRMAAREAGERWIEMEPGRFSLELPYVFEPYPDFGGPVPLRKRPDLGLQITAEQDRIVEVSFKTRSEDVTKMRALRRRWKRAHVDDETWTFRR